MPKIKVGPYFDVATIQEKVQFFMHQIKYRPEEKPLDCVRATLLSKEIKNSEQYTSSVSMHFSIHKLLN